MVDLQRGDSHSFEGQPESVDEVMAFDNRCAVSLRGIQPNFTRRFLATGARDRFFLRAANGAVALEDLGRRTGVVLGTEANLEECERRLKNSTNKRISVDRELAHHYRWKASRLIGTYRDKLEVTQPAPDPATPCSA